MLAALLLVLLAASGPALAAAPSVPLSDQREMASLLGEAGGPDLALVPTSLPAHFGFESFTVSGIPLGLDVTLADQRFLKSPTQARMHEFSFDTAYFKGTLASCSTKSRKTLRVGGSRVYTEGATVWRCLRTSRGRLVKASAHGRLNGRLDNAALAAVVVSARPTQ